MATTGGSVFGADLAKLPSGVSGIPRSLVLASQRQRLIHGVTLAVAEQALNGTTIRDIAERAGVSKKTFYEHFPDKLACFLAAYDHGAAALMGEVVEATVAARRAGLGPTAQFRDGTRAYLSFLQREAPYSRTFCLEMLAAGPEATARHRAGRAAFADTVAVWHGLYAAGQPAWPAVSAFSFEAATGLIYEIASGRIADGASDQLLDIADDLAQAALAVLGIRA